MTSELIRIGTAPNEYVAQMWRGALAGEGIQALVRVAGAGTAYFASAFMAHDLYVLAGDAERAEAILDALTLAPDDL